mgnify:CR=1 FL=1
MKEKIAPTHCSFIPGRGTTDNIVVVQEAIHSFANKTGKVGHMILKIDLEKAYDRISWDFLRWVLMDIGMPSPLIQLIMFCITSTEMNVLWNGELTSDFKPTRGLRQGDPLSPSFFVLCLQKLEDMIDEAVNLGVWKPISLSQGGPVPYLLSLLMT